MHTVLALTTVASALAAAGAWAAPVDHEPRAAAGSRLLALAALTWAVVAAAETPWHRPGSVAALALALAAFLLLVTRRRRVGHARLALVVPGLLAIGGAEAAAIVADDPELVAAAAAGWLLVAVAAPRRRPAHARATTAQHDRGGHAYHDALTGLANRELLERRAALALRDGEGAAAIAVELDDFGAVAHLLGTAAGDELLVAAARRLAGAMRDGDTVARLAAARFAVLAPGVAGDRRAGELARRAAEALRAPFAIDGSALCVRTSTAIAVAHGGAPEVGFDLIRALEARFDGAGRTGWDGRTGELDGALARGELELAYQPVFDLAGRGIRSVEALLRWRHSEHGELPAASFVAAMEDSGVLADAGAWALREACEQWRCWLDSGAGWARLGMRVNVSASQLFDGRLMSELRGALFASGIPPARLSLELGEAALLHDPDSAAAAISELRALGVRVALDDFGAGLAPIASLRRFAIDAVKVDARDTELAVAAAAASEALGRETVAGRLEHPGQLAALRAAGCTQGQGQLLARPRGAEAVAILLANSRQAAA